MQIVLRVKEKLYCPVTPGQVTTLKPSPHSKLHSTVILFMNILPLYKLKATYLSCTYFFFHSYNLQIILYLKKETTATCVGYLSNRTIFFKEIKH